MIRGLRGFNPDSDPALTRYESLGATVMRAAVMVAIGLGMIASARADDLLEIRKPIQIPPEELGLALQTLGDIEGLHVVFLSEDVEKRNAHGVSGTLTYPEALQQLLSGTDLTFRFFDAQTVMILPISAAQGAPAEPKPTPVSDVDAGKVVVAALDTVKQMPQVTITATRQSDAKQLEYYRLLAALSRSDYQRIAKTLPFVESGIVKFPGAEGPQHRLKSGQHIQSAGLDGMVLWRVFNITPKKAESQIQIHNSNSVPVFVELDFGRAGLGKGAYAALAPGETAIWSWPPTLCLPTVGHKTYEGLFEGCEDYNVWPATVHVRMLKGWLPG
jgi:secretin/TonB-like protein